jgi:predicted nucleotidyltransferase
VFFAFLPENRGFPMPTYEKLKQRWQAEKTARTQQAKARKAALLTKGIPIFQKCGVQKVVLFGSVADNSSEETSDLDLLAMPLAAENYWECRRELEQVLDCPIDLYTQDDEQTFVAKILQRGEVVYEIHA